MIYMDICPKPQSVTLPINLFRFSCPDKDDKGERNFCIIPHNHIQVELLLVEKGEMIVSVDNMNFRLQKGDAVVINPFEIHSGVYGKPDGFCVYLCLTFSANHFGFWNRSALGKAADEINALRCGFENFYPSGSATNAVINDCMNGMYNNFGKNTRASECAMISCFYRLMSALFEKHYHENQKREKRNVEFIKAVQKIVNEKYKEPLTTKAVSGEMFMTPSRFCQLFKENFGRSFLSYLSGYRILRSKEYLGSELTIARIASEVGFSDYCHFSRSFHEQVGIPPSVFFGKRRN